MPDYKTASDALLGAAVLVFGWMFRRHMAEFDVLVKNAVTRAELKDVMVTLRDERKEMHADNLFRLDAINAKIDTASFAVLLEKVKNLEQDYELLHQWKNVMLPAQFERQSALFSNLLKEMDTRLDRLEAQR